MKTLFARGDIDHNALYDELRAALGDPADPQRWYFNGSAGEVTVFFDDSIADSAVQGVLDAHLAAAPKRAHNEPLDDEMAELENDNPFKHRSFREWFLSIFSAINYSINQTNQRLQAVQAEVRLVPGHEQFTVATISPINANAGVTKVKNLDDTIAALRAQRLS
jgi:hypothetical protein